MSFDPLQLRPEASLNRTRLAALPRAEADWVGRPAFDLLGLDALRRLAEEQGFSSGDRVTWALASGLQSSDDDVSRCAAGIVEVFGRWLGHLITTLTSDAAHEADESEWRAVYLEHWARVRHVWLGGGIAAAGGGLLAEAARGELARLGYGDRRVTVAEHAARLALLGAARSREVSPRLAVVLDFGGSAVKRGIASLDPGGSLAQVDVLPSLSVAELGGNRHVAEMVADVVIETTRRARERGEVDRRVTVSLASYLPPPHGPAPRGPYSALFTAESRAILAERAPGYQISFLHYGTAAARAVPGREQAAVISLSTALGVGFPSSAGSPRPVAATFMVNDVAEPG